jgi:hypothetical protein
MHSGKTKIQPTLQRLQQTNNDLSFFFFLQMVEVEWVEWERLIMTGPKRQGLRGLLLALPE